MSIRPFELWLGSRDDRLARVASALCCLALLASPCVQGCTRDGSEEDEHLEHVIPLHKPASYADMVAQLDMRWIRLQNNADEQQLAELGDIVEWLPELAADSDLNRAQWEQVQSLSTKLQELYARLAGGTLEDADRNRWQEIIAALRELVPASDDRLDF